MLNKTARPPQKKKIKSQIANKKLVQAFQNSAFRQGEFEILVIN